MARLVQLHGGAVAVSSAPDQGSCFTCWLPWRDPVVPDVILPEEPGTSPLALVIEHNQPAAALMQTQPERGGLPRAPRGLRGSGAVLAPRCGPT